MKTHPIQFEYMVDQTKAGLLGQFLITALMNLLLIGTVFPESFLYLWDAMVISLLAHRYLNFLRFKKDQSRHDALRTKRWLIRYVADVLLLGLLWAGLFVQIACSMPIEYNYISMAVGLGLSGAAIVTLGPVFAVYLSFITPMLSSLIVLFGVRGTHIYAVCSLVTTLGLFYLLYSSYKYSQSFLLILKVNEQLRNSELEALEILGKAGEYRDMDTGAHVLRVGYAAYCLAKAIGFPEKDAKLLMLASPLHDVGKIGIPDNILLKPGKLTDIEFNSMKEHAKIGAGILDNSKSPIIQKAKIIACTHHEKWDGSGYPNQLKGEDIPIEGRIVAICDVYDALTSDRPYKKRWSEEEASNYIRDNAGKHFDPKLTELFIAELTKIGEFTQRLHSEVGSILHPLIKLTRET
ncbi:MAG: HD domain-containing protein [Sideroxydans sp.]|nr:HD domain-containing protein [Sideroxydans sp.]